MRISLDFVADYLFGVFSEAAVLLAMMCSIWLAATPSGAVAEKKYQVAPVSKQRVPRRSTINRALNPEKPPLTWVGNWNIVRLFQRWLNSDSSHIAQRPVTFNRGQYLKTRPHITLTASRLKRDTTSYPPEVESIA